MTEEKKKIVIDLAGVMDKITPELIEGMAPLLTNPLIMAVEKDNENLRKRLRIAEDALDWIGNHMTMSMALNEGHLCQQMKAYARSALTRMEKGLETVEDVE